MIGTFRSAKAEKNIVITHHVPTLKNYPESYKKSKINNAFATELEDFISSNNIYAWIYGHSHINIQEFEINGTRMLTNQLGYVFMDEHFTFRNNVFLET